VSRKRNRRVLSWGLLLTSDRLLALNGAKKGRVSAALFHAT